MISFTFVTESPLDVQGLTESSKGYFSFTGVRDFPIFKSLYNDEERYSLDISEYQLRFDIVERSESDMIEIVKLIKLFLSNEFKTKTVGVRYSPKIKKDYFKGIDDVNVLRLH